jgi:cation transport ATPase
VRDMLSVLSVLGLEERIGEVPGVESVTVNQAAGSATVHMSEHKPAGKRAVVPTPDAAPGAQPAMSADMAHEMGHGGKDLPAMVRDMRNRFWICLIFTVPIFVYAPMGGFCALRKFTSRRSCDLGAGKTG